MGDEGEWLNKVSVLYEAAPLYAPRELRWEEVAPPQNWLDKADWPEPIADVQCKAPPNMFRHVLYQINKLKTIKY